MQVVLSPLQDVLGRKRSYSSADAPEDCLAGAAPKRRYVEARRQLHSFESWVAHLRTRYPAMSDKVRAPSVSAP